MRGKFRFIVWLIVLCTLFIGCSKEEGLKENLATVKTKAYIEKEVPLDGGMKRVIDLKTNDEGQLEAITCDDGIFAHWTLKGDKWIKTDDKRFEGLYAKNSIAYVTYDKEGILYLVFQNEKDEYGMYVIEEGQLPKALPIDFEHPTNIDDTVYGVAIMPNKDIIIGYWDSFVYYDGKIYEEKKQMDVEYRVFATCKDELVYIDKNNNLQSIDGEKESPSLTIPDGQNLLITLKNEGDGLWILTNKGLYKYLLGGNLIEEVMTSSGKTFNQIVPAASELLEDEKGSFYIVFQDESLKTQAINQYVYGDIEDQQKEIQITQLTLYTMYESYALKALVAQFNYEHPHINVNIKEGMHGHSDELEMYPLATHTSAVEEAVKSLNNDLLTGNGPDILMLDFLPIESMIEKNILLDLSELVHPGIKDGTFYETLAKTYERYGEIPALPTKFNILTMVGDEGWMKGVTDLTSFADAMEKVYQSSDKLKADDVSWQSIVRLFYLNSEPAWQMSNGSLDKEKIKSFMEDTKRLVDVGCGEKYLFDISRYGYMDWVDGVAEVGIGSMAGPTCMNIIDIGIREHGGRVTYLPGQVDKVYMPAEIWGINKASKNQEAALAFLDYMLSPYAQAFGYGGGATPFLINKTVADDAHNLPNLFLWNGGRMDIKLNSGRELVYDFPNEKNVREANGFAYNVEVAAPVDLAMREIFIEETTPYYEGQESLDEALEKVINKLNLYRSE